MGFDRHRKNKSVETRSAHYIPNALHSQSMNDYNSLLPLSQNTNKENGLRISEIRNVADYGRKEVSSKGYLDYSSVV